MKNLFNRFYNYIKSIINDNGEFCLHRSIILLAILSLWTILYQMIAQSFNIFQLYGPILLFNVIPIFLVMCLLYFIIGKISYSFIITNTILSVLLLVNHYKIKFRDEPLNPSDFILGKEAKNIINNYDISLDLIVIFIIILCTITFWLAIKKIKNKRPGLMISVIGIALTLTLSTASYNLIYKNNRIYNALLSNLGIYHETVMISTKGLVYSLINNVSVMKYSKPEEFSANRVNNILNSYPTSSLPKNTPDVIAVMGEAFTDMQNWDGIDLNDNNPYHYYNYLKSIGCNGKIFVPGFGGGTAATEFEFLTGNNTSAISPTLPTAYKTLITKQAYSIVRLFKEAGFYADAIHPGTPWFYNRQNVYPRLGFDKFTSIEDYDGEIHKKTSYANDTIAADMIISAYEEHKSKNDDSGYFSFTVTIQNHGPYNDDNLVYNEEFIKKTDDMSDSDYYIVNNYLGGIKDNDEFLWIIYEYMNKLEKPTVLVFFGDHLPYFDDESALYSKLGYETEGDDYQSYENKYTTDYLIVGNKAFLNSVNPRIKGEQELISANYLAVKMFDYMNIDLPSFHAFSKDMMEQLPVISKKSTGKTKSFDEKLTDVQLKYLDDYKNIQYYNIKEYITDEGENK